MVPSVAEHCFPITAPDLPPQTAESNRISTRNQRLINHHLRRSQLNIQKRLFGAITLAAFNSINRGKVI